MCQKYETKAGSDCAKNLRRYWGWCVRLVILLSRVECMPMGDMMDDGPGSACAKIVQNGVL
jgi:hypothetical protein